MLNKKWFKHLAPKEFHRHFHLINQAAETFKLRHPSEFWHWVGSAMDNGCVEVAYGDVLPTLRIGLIEIDGVVRCHPRSPSELMRAGVESAFRDGDEYDDIGKPFEGSRAVDFEVAIEIIRDPIFIDIQRRIDSGELECTTDMAEQHYPRAGYTLPTLVFTCPAGMLIDNDFQKSLGKIPNFVMYEHIFGKVEDGFPTGGFFYIGITQRDWKRRWQEHRNAVRRGSNLKFHRTYRELAKSTELSYVNHVVLGHAETVGKLYDYEEARVDAQWDDPKVLNMIPGGRKGLKYLREHKIIGASVHPMPDHVERILEKWVAEHPRKGLPAPWVSEKWKDDEYASKVICGPAGRLSVHQVQQIRALHATGKCAVNIAKEMNISNVLQVKRVVDGVTYSRVQ